MRQEQLRYCTSVLGEVLHFISCLMSFSPDSGRWGKLVGKEWHGEPLKPVIVNYLKAIKTRENDRGNRTVHRQRAECFYIAARGVGQVLSYVEDGLPVLHAKTREHALILQGNR